MTHSSRLKLLTLSLAVASFTLLQSLVLPVLPSIQRDLHTDTGTITWALTAWLLAASVATPLFGRVGDMIGKDRMLTFALVTIAVGCGISAAAPSAAVLIAGRVVQGLGGAVMALSFGILRDEIAPARLASAVGMLSGVLAVGGGLGIVLAGPLEDALGWRAVFWLPMLVTTAVAVLAHRVIPASPVRTAGRPSVRAAVLLSGWLLALLFALSEGSAWGWGSARVIGLLATAAVLVAVWVRTELRSASPLIDMRMMRLPAVWTTNAVALLFGASMFPIYAFLPQFMQVPASTGYGFGASVTTAGVLMLPMLVTMGLASSFSGSVSSRIGVKSQLVWGSALTATACVGFTAWHAAPWEVALGSGVFGLGLGLAYAAIMTLIVQGVPAHQTGAASGMNANLRTIGGSIGTAVTSAIITAAPGSDGLPSEGAFTHGFEFLAALAATAVGLALLVPAARRHVPLATPQRKEVHA